MEESINSRERTMLRCVVDMRQETLLLLFVRCLPPRRQNKRRGRRPTRANRANDLRVPARGWRVGWLRHYDLHRGRRAVNGIAMGFDMSARQAFTVEMASREDLLNAI